MQGFAHSLACIVMASVISCAWLRSSINVHRHGLHHFMCMASLSIHVQHHGLHVRRAAGSVRGVQKVVPGTPKNEASKYQPPQNKGSELSERMSKQSLNRHEADRGSVYSSRKNSEWSLCMANHGATACWKCKRVVDHQSTEIQKNSGLLIHVCLHCDLIVQPGDLQMERGTS